MDLIIRRMVESDVDSIAQAFAHWNKQREQYERYWRENQEGQRVTLVAVSSEQVVGYTNVIWQPEYEPFREAGMPEINDMNVIAEFQKHGIGSALIRESERIAIEHGKKSWVLALVLPLIMVPLSGYTLSWATFRMAEEHSLHLGVMCFF
jgi:GNAT superfamily N-acetyltransferase